MKHGYSRTPEYRALTAAKQRCYNLNNEFYSTYGGKGVIVCDEWLNNPEAFINHIGKRPSKKYSLDRIDPFGNYEPGNVRWATATEQTLNRRNTLFVIYNGEEIALAELARKAGLSYITVFSRLTRDKRTLDEALTKGRLKRRKL